MLFTTPTLGGSYQAAWQTSVWGAGRGLDAKNTIGAPKDATMATIERGSGSVSPIAITAQRWLLYRSGWGASRNNRGGGLSEELAAPVPAHRA